MKKVKKFLKYATVNRVALLGYSMLASGLVGGIYSVLERDMTSLAVSCSSILGGTFILSGTDFGNETYRIYERIKEHIQKNKCLDEEVVKLYSKFYCERQGVYMAAKELGHLDEYKNLMKGKKVNIPNF